MDPIDSMDAVEAVDSAQALKAAEIRQAEEALRARPAAVPRSAAAPHAAPEADADTDPAPALTAAQAQAALVAFNRFGLGARPGGMNRIGRNPRAAVLAELAEPGIMRIRAPRLPDYAAACAVIHTGFHEEIELNGRELTARIEKHMEPEIGFVERLVLFFSNHFSMTIHKDGAVRATVGQLERDVIRRHVLGRFEDMLLGVMMHPAMLAYLDNASSVGPNSEVGRRSGAGTNENLAREMLELHTLGVHGGYDERDVRSLSLILSGWSFVRGWEAEQRRNGGRPGNRGQFIFREYWHEPGAQRLLGERYGQRGRAKGIAVLRALAAHPSTAQNIAFKLVRHFLTDHPTPQLVNPIARAFRESGGNLRATARALVNLPEAWSLPMTKLRTPYELQIAQMRATGRVYPADARWPFTESLRSLRHLPWQRPAPDGYSDDSAYWASPDAMRVRMETAQIAARELMRVGIYRRWGTALVRDVVGPVLSAPSRRALFRAPTQQASLATLFMIPEFQRR